MPSKSDLIPLKHFAPDKDLRRKLTKEQRKEIKTAYEEGQYSYNGLAKQENYNFCCQSN